MGGFADFTTKGILELLETMSKSSARNSKTALAISITAVLIAGGSLFFSSLDSKSNENWNGQQLQKLDSLFQVELKIKEELVNNTIILRNELDSIGQKINKINTLLEKIGQIKKRH